MTFCALSQSSIRYVALSAIWVLWLPGFAGASTVSYWRFEEGAAGQGASGPILDSSGNGNSGTPLRNPVYQADVKNNPIPGTGAANHLSMSFDGSSQRIFIPDNPSFAITSSLTLEASIKPRSINLSGLAYPFPYVVVFRGDDRGGFDPYYLAVSQTNTGKYLADFQISNSSGTSITVSAEIPALNEWHNIAGTLDGATGKMSIYLDGVLASSATTGIRPFGPLDAAGSPGLGIGEYQSDNPGLNRQYFDGLIDEVRISNTALAPSQFLSAAPWQVADVNNDGHVTVGDLGILATHFNQTLTGGRSVGDLNLDGSVTVGDLGILSTYFGQPDSAGSVQTFDDAKNSFPQLSGTSVPDPSIATALLLPILGRLRRKPRPLLH